MFDIVFYPSLRNTVRSDIRVIEQFQNLPTPSPPINCHVIYDRSILFLLLLCGSQSNLSESDNVRHVLSMIPALLTLAGSLVILFLRLPSCFSRRDRRYTHIMQLKAFPIISNGNIYFRLKLRDKEEMRLARKPSLVYAPGRSLPTHPELKRINSN